VGGDGRGGKGVGRGVGKEGAGVGEVWGGRRWRGQRGGGGRRVGGRVPEMRGPVKYSGKKKKKGKEQSLYSSRKAPTAEKVFGHGGKKTRRGLPDSTKGKKAIRKEKGLKRESAKTFHVLGRGEDRTTICLREWGGPEWKVKNPSEQKKKKKREGRGGGR